jgi:type IV pilus assembly protein PilX
MQVNRIIRPPKSQAGIVLFIALIALVALSLAGIALVRSVGTGNQIAGNLAFRQATLQASDHGIEAAFIALNTLPLRTNRTTSVTGQYTATRLDINTNLTAREPDWANDIPWARISCRNNSNAVVSPCSSQEYQVKYFIERLCGCDQNVTLSGQIPVCAHAATIDPKTYCQVQTGSEKTGSKGAFGTSFESVTAIYYRVTVQVTGPRNTTTYAQTIFSFG